MTAQSTEYQGIAQPRARGALLELDAAVGAGAVDEGGGGATGGAGQVLGVVGDRDRDRREAFAREAGAPVAAQQLGQGR